MTINPASAIFVRPRFQIHASNFILNLGQETKIMGVLNMTPDSFSRDGMMINHKIDSGRVMQRAYRLVRQGADIIDVGGESTRPGAIKISETEEIKRVIPIIRLLAKKIKVPISVDTYKTRVAQEALDSGAVIVNNIKGTKLSKQFLKMARSYDAVLVLMHSRKTPRTMQKNIYYKNIMDDICQELSESIENCLDNAIKLDKIIIDPGIGFGKTVEHNLEIIRRLRELQKLSCPVLLGTSRKSFIGTILNTDVSHRIMGTAATVAAGILNGAHIVRVHDVSQMKEVTLVTDAILNFSKSFPPRLNCHARESGNLGRGKLQRESRTV